MRRIGRVRRLASPSKVAVIGLPATAPIDQPAPGAGIAEIERPRRLGKAADADALDLPGALAGALDRGAERPHRLGGVE